MTSRVTIGEFSTMARLSRKALRHYHDLGLLQPAEVDAVTGYRYYETAQLGVARVIRRFRDLDMPVPELRAYLAAQDDAARREIVIAHLDRMQAQLRQTQDAVTALRGLIEPVGAPPRIEVRTDPETTAAAISQTVRLDVLLDWWHTATQELHDALCTAGISAGGPLGGIYAQALFADEQGEATVWLPVNGPVPEHPRVRSLTIPAGTFAVAVHDGPDARIDETYAALGTYAAEHGISCDQPVRERYLAGVFDDSSPLITEIAWPIAALPEGNDDSGH